MAAADEIYIAGIALTPLGKFPELSVKDLTRKAVDGALADAGIGMDRIGAAWFANTRQGLMENQNTIRGQAALRAMGFESIPVANIENACASSTTAMIQAIAHIKAGMCDIALVVGAEKMFYPDKPRELAFSGFLGGTDINAIDETRARLMAIGAGVAPDEAMVEAGDGARHSFFMDIYAAMARLHMKTYGTTREQIAAAAAKNHFHSTMNPLAQYRVDMTVDQVLADKPITWPLTRAMCAPISDGAAAAVLCGGETLKRLGDDRAVHILASRLVSGSDRAPGDYANHMTRKAAALAYQDAALGPADIDVAEVHDATSFAEILQIECLGLCDAGGGGPATEAGETRLGGRVPVNTSGGLVSKGHPIAATGLGQLHELVTQLRGEAGKRQVAGARRAIAENGGGFVGVEEAATVVTILGKD